MRSTTIISITLLSIFTATIEGSIVVRGNDCEFIQLESITSNTGCSSGTKFVLKVKTIVESRINLITFFFQGASKIRKQFLIMDDKVILAFVARMKKFPTCESFKDITASVECKVVAGLDSVDLSTASKGYPYPSGPGPRHGM